MVTWFISIDFERDGTYTDITSDVRYASWNLGFVDEFERVAGQSNLELELLNADGKYSPENSGGTHFGKFGPHRRVRVQSISTLGTITHYHGWTQSIQPDSNTETPYARLMATDGKPYLENRSIPYDLYQDTTADVIIRDIVTGLREWAPSITPSFVLGIDSLGTGVLASEAESFNLDTGQTAFTYVGDTWDEDTSPMRAISEVVKSEYGRLFYNRSGEIRFYARDGFANLGRTPAGTLTETDYLDIQYSYGNNIINDVRMTIQPRTFTLDETLIFDLPDAGAFELNNQSEKTVRVRYELQDSEDDIATIPEDCRAVVSWTPNSTLVDYSVEFFARYALVTVINSADFEFVTVDNIQIYGPNISRKNKLEISASDPDSIALYGRRTLNIDAPLLEDEAAAQIIVNNILNRYKSPVGRVASMFMQTSAEKDNLAETLQWAIGTRFTIDDGPTYHEAAYFIIGESHTLTNGLKQHNVTYDLTPGQDEDYFTLNISSLDGEDALFA